MKWDALQTLLYAVLIGVALIPVLVLQRKRARRLEEVLRALASRVDGQLRAGHWLTSRPSLLLGIRGQAARVEFFKRGGKSETLYTDLNVELAGKPRFPVEIAPEGFLTSVGKLLGMREVQVGDDAFDERFCLESSDEARLRAFLTPRVRGALLSLRSMEGSDEVRVRFEGTELQVRKRGWMDDEDRAGRFLELSTQVVEGYLDAVGVPEPALPDPARATHCPICADGFRERVVACPGCGARHHPECFEINDGCGRCGAKAPRVAG